MLGTRKVNDLAICITSFKRARYLDRCLDSVRNAGVRNVSVATSAPTKDVLEVLDKHSKSDWNYFKVASLPLDIGCSRSWELAAYNSNCARVLVLHDDDVLVNELGATYTSTIQPALDSGIGFASWRANLLFDNGRTQNTEYWHGPTRVMPSGVLEGFLLRPKRLSLSPIISVFNREVLIHALKEAEHGLTDYLHPSMRLGDEILAYLRHCSSFSQWLYVDKILSRYGCHDGSGTVQYQKQNNIARLSKGYDQARSYYTQHKNNKPAPDPKLILVSAPFESNSPEEQKRFDNARRTWNFHFHQGTMLDFPFTDFPRSSKDIGDSVSVPYLKDCLDYGMRYALPEDVIGYANLDLGFSTLLPEQAIWMVKQHGVCVGWRRTMAFSADYPLRTCKNGLRDGGVDSIFVSPTWWKEHRDRIPDCFVASNFWDYTFRVYAERATDGKCYLFDSTIHAPHSSFFSRHKLENPRNKHNHALAKQFFQSIGQNRNAETLHLIV